MRAARAIIRRGDPTSHGGEVLEGIETSTIHGKPIAGKHHRVSCPRCKGNFEIAEGVGNHSFHGVNTAVEGMLTTCGASLIATQHFATIEVDLDQGCGSQASTGSAGAARNSAASRSISFDEQIRFVASSGAALANVDYVLTLDSGEQVRGTTDAAGQTRRIETDVQRSIVEAELTPRQVYACDRHATHAAESATSAAVPVPLNAELKTNDVGIGSSVVEQEVNPDARSMTSGEIEMSRLVFKDSIDYDLVKIHRGGLLGLPNMSNNAMTPFGHIHFPHGSYKPDFSVELSPNKIWFIHEMVHVWQYQRGYSVALRGILIGATGGYASGAPVYAYDPVNDAGKTMPDFNMEQQGDLIAHYFDAAAFLGGEGNPIQHAMYVGRLEFYTRVLAVFLTNPQDASLLPAASQVKP